ncbi:hypothetical protein BKK79_17635 [Cupriavidus sp. USMAA2-4]|uniref:DUF2867 domain-containing protein n=1 Tax=Cupriavidus malaysiensis TaxID=367825 RepID=A0ABM6F6F6_9BURK|nr:MULTISPECIES: hypothetical protein [Cupriavidus]AOY93418.1 hypothetical protein BKK79_17635 [Cupriavidus sp. USMAA2-4]AOZ07048.1 hypothetical protein BKK80_15370 [Cupriavidus malaysiensis]
MSTQDGPRRVRETRVSATLPATDIEWLHRSLPDGGSQWGLSLTLQADERAMERWLRGVAVPAGAHAVEGWLLAPWTIWATWTAWAPWLAWHPLLAMVLHAAPRPRV